MKEWTVGQAVGPLLIPAVGGNGLTPDTTALFILGAGLAGALVLSGLLIRNAKSPTPHTRSKDGSTRTILRTPGVARAIGTSALIVAAVDLTVVYVPALGVERGLTAGSVGALLAVRAVASMASRLVLGRAAATLGRTRLMSTSIALSAVTFILLAVPLPEWALFVVIALLGLGLGIGQPLTMSWVTEQVPPSRRGTALAVRLAGNRLSQIAVPSAVGALGSLASAGAVLGATGVILGFTLLLIRGVRLDGDAR